VQGKFQTNKKINRHIRVYGYLNYICKQLLVERIMRQAGAKEVQYGAYSKAISNPPSVKCDYLYVQ